MNGWIILLAIVVVAALFVLLPVGVATFAHYRRPRRLGCPLAGTDESVQVDATGAALSELMGLRALRVKACSRWPLAWGCRQQCVDEAPDRRATSAQTTGARSILVPLDGTPESEAVLAGVGAIAREEGARIRLLRVSVPPPAIEVGNRIIAYADQETSRIELDGLVYLKKLAERLPGTPVERVVRFGDPVQQIVEEAQSSGVDLIAMATHDRTGIARLRWGSVTDAVASATRIPVMRVAARQAPEETADLAAGRGAT